MKRLDLVRVVSLAFASVTVSACGRDTAPEPAPPADSVAVTEARVPAAAGENTPESTAAKAPVENEPVASDEAVCAPTVVGTTEIAARVSPAPVPGGHVARAKGATSVHAPAALNEAIAEEVDALADVADDSSAASTAPAKESRSAATPVSTSVTLTGGTVPAPAKQDDELRASRVAFESRLPRAYELERIRFVVDGHVAYDGKAATSLGVPAGNHVVEVIADYRLHDSLFSYVDGYRVELKSTQVLPASRAPVAFVATAVPAGGVTTPMEKRAALTWRSFPEAK